MRRLSFFLFCAAVALVQPIAAQTITGKYRFTPKPESGAWYNPAESGTGWFIDVQGNILFGASFGYEPQGDSRFWTMSGVMSLPPDPTGATNQAGLAMAELQSAAFSFSGGQCHGCPYMSPQSAEAQPGAKLTWTGPRQVIFQAGNGTATMSPFDTTGFDLSGDWQGTYHFFNATGFTKRPVYRVARSTAVRNYHIDPGYPTGFEVTLPTVGAHEYTVTCVFECDGIFEPLKPALDATWWVDPVTGNGGIMYVRAVNQALFPTANQVYMPTGTVAYGRWSPRLWATSKRIVGRSYVAFLQTLTRDYVSEIELVRIDPAQAPDLQN